MQVTSLTTETQRSSATTLWLLSVGVLLATCMGLLAVQPSQASAAINPAGLSTTQIGLQSGPTSEATGFVQALPVFETADTTTGSVTTRLAPQSTIDSPVLEHPDAPSEPRKALPRQLNPNPRNKLIIVDVSEQRLYALEDGVVVFKDLVSTGLTGPTPLGNHKIISKVRSQTMSGPGYWLPGVQWVMYFTTAGHSTHSTYWHNNFGHPMSHGCVNMRTASAKWLYEWAPYGTTVKVRN